jgi:hypothetical protein
VNLLNLLASVLAYTPIPDEGFYDSDLVFADAQSIPTDGADDLSEHTVDLTVAAPNIGMGRPAYVKVQPTTAFAVASGTASLLDIVLYTKAAAATTIGAATSLGIIGTLPYNAAAGTTYSFGLPQYPKSAYLRYLNIALSPRSDDTLFTAGAVDAWLDFN